MDIRDSGYECGELVDEEDAACMSDGRYLESRTSSASVLTSLSV